MRCAYKGAGSGARSGWVTPAVAEAAPETAVARGACVLTVLPGAATGATAGKAGAGPGAATGATELTGIAGAGAATGAAATAANATDGTADGAGAGIRPSTASGGSGAVAAATETAGRLMTVAGCCCHITAAVAELASTASPAPSISRALPGRGFLSMEILQVRGWLDCHAQPTGSPRSASCVFKSAVA